MSGTLYGILPPAYTVLYHMAGAFLLTAGVLGCEGLQKFFSWKPFLYLGDISYSLYLLHFPVIATFSCWFFLGVHETFGYHLTAALNFVLTTALVLLLSTLSRNYLEPLGQKWERLVVSKGQKNTADAKESDRG